MPEKEVVLITGVSKGIGQATARLLTQKGFIVFGTSRNPLSTEKIRGADLVPLDVCMEESVRSCMEMVLKQAGRLDCLVNNAGYMLAGAIEEAKLEEVKAQFETNFFGVVRMVKAVLPIMRKQASGQIINISSMGGLTPHPFWGFYSASKFALEGYTEALRHEVMPFNIKVSLVEPGIVKTDLMCKQQSPGDRINDYEPWRQRALDTAQQYAQKAIEPTLVAELILRIIQKKSKRLRHTIGMGATRRFLLRRFLPERLFEQATRRRFHLDVDK